MTRSAQAFFFALLAAGFNAGCRSDHRISVQEFVALQEQSAAQETQRIAALPLPQTDQYLGKYKVGPGDVLAVTITSAQTPSPTPVPVRVDRDGNVELPIVGSVAVNGMELEDVEDAIRKAYVPRVYNDAVAHVELTTPDATNVLVVGTVTTAGLVPLKRTERNMLHAIVGAGGVTTDSSGVATLRRIRKPGAVEKYDLTDPTQLNAALALAPLESGDIIHMEAARPNTVYVGGLVNRAAPQYYTPGARVTALQALAGANGLRTDVTPHEGTLVRRLSDGRDVQVRLDLGRMARGEDPNVMLAEGDILWVPATFGTKVEEFINRNFFMRAGISVNYNVSGLEFLNRRELQGSRRSGAGGSGGTLQDSFDPFGFLGQSSALESIANQPAAGP